MYGIVSLMPDIADPRKGGAAKRRSSSLIAIKDGPCEPQAAANRNAYVTSALPPPDLREKMRGCSPMCSGNRD